MGRSTVGASNKRGIRHRREDEHEDSEQIPPLPPPSGNGPSAPTGQVFNGRGSGFPVDGTPAAFILVTEDGTIAGWRPGLTPSTVAVIATSRI